MKVALIRMRVIHTTHQSVTIPWINLIGGKLALLFPFYLFLHKMSPLIWDQFHAHFKLVLPQVTKFVRKHASI